MPKRSVIFETKACFVERTINNQLLINSKIHNFQQKELWKLILEAPIEFDRNSLKEQMRPVFNATKLCFDKTTKSCILKWYLKDGAEAIFTE